MPRKKISVDLALKVCDNLNRGVAPTENSDSQTPVTHITGYRKSSKKQTNSKKSNKGNPDKNSGNPLQKPSKAENKPNRLLKVTPEVLAEVTKFGSLGIRNELIAAHYGISVGTWYNVCKDSPELAIARRNGKRVMLEEVASALKSSAISGNVVAGIFIMKTQGGWSDTWSENEDGDMQNTSPTLSITSTNPVDAMREYEKIMKDS